MARQATARGDEQATGSAEAAETAAKPRKLRADAARNREKVITAAADVFAEGGTDASLEEIARRAGVGVGTLYRHFPTRAALIEEVYRGGVTALCARAPELLATLPPDEALEEWVLGFQAYVGRKRGTATALRAALGDESTAVFADTHEQLRQASRMLFDAAHAAGKIRGDVDPMEVMRTVSGVCSAGADAKDPAAGLRMLRLVLDGLRYGAEG
ncbi:TetR/AcrR family transcriptional regulator [Actinotalea sp. M2MS4P-6]|uniref:TetR/AcrR family transcriptional regulator n=1 Tax=Actinotalea sp. M2MS4P-6 TaxID=2983762 RepID=UPI0021E4885C|nr:TetR/AcrR family transcriptional regulator [Actinotalea sp. M2MS4P-6]MCV2395469.1 TetR/AcrR family transcriptional regulator [Actinotalea sp. M2MS4P-6]